MSLTAAAVFAVFGVGLVLGLLRHPIYALLSYVWIYYNHPPAWWWGADLPDFRYSLIAALVALVGAVRIRTPVVDPWYANPGAKLLIAYCIWMWCQTPWAVNFDAHVDGAILATKYVLLFYLIYRIVSDEERIQMFFWGHVIGCFILGWAAYTTIVHGRLESVVIPGVDDSNMLAIQLITGAAFAGFMFIAISGYRRWIPFLILPFVLNAIILTESRGGFLSLAVSGPVAWYLAPRKYRRFVSLAVVLGAALFLVLASDQFWDRMSTILHSTGEAGHTEQRLELIGPQIKMFLDHPLGAGHRGNEFLSPYYMDAGDLSQTGRRSAHNTFIAALVDQGVPGAILLLSLYYWVGLSLLRLKRLDAQGLPPLLGIYRAAIGTALASCFISGLFLNLLKLEAQVWLLALLASLIALTRTRLAVMERSQATGENGLQRGPGSSSGQGGVIGNGVS